MNEPRLLVGIADAQNKLHAAKLDVGAVGEQSCSFPSTFCPISSGGTNRADLGPTSATNNLFDTNKSQRHSPEDMGQR